MTTVQTTRWHRLDDADAIAREATRRILAIAEDAIAARGRFRIVLAGGTTPRRAYEMLVKAPTDWSLWEIYFGDERCLPPQDSERNSHMADRAWLDHVPVPTGNSHPIPAELGPEAAARAYDPVVSSAVPFDLVLLGMGEDGHTASLFPGQDHPPDAWVHPVHNAPKPPPDRVSLSLRALGETRRLIILVSGTGKHDAVRRWKQGDRLPVSQVEPREGVDVLIDHAAWG